MNIKSTSYSRLLDYESCPLKAKLKVIDRIPDPNPHPAGLRGTAIHSACEDFVSGANKLLCTDAQRHFEVEFKSLRQHYKAGRVSLEGEWAFDTDWNPTDWKAGWLRVKLDAYVALTPQHAVVIDYKTGKRFGNEVKHGEQLQLYALSVLLRYPEIRAVTAELWYLDVNDLVSFSVTRDYGLRLLKPFDKRFHKMTSATSFPATPNIESCKYCPFHPTRGTGHCKAGV